MKEGDVVIVQGKAGLVYEIYNNGVVLINYGGVVEVLNKNAVIDYPPKGLEEVLKLKIYQHEQDFQEEMQKYTSPMRQVLNEYHQERTLMLWMWNGIRKFFRKG